MVGYIISSHNQEGLVTLLEKQVGHRWTIIVSIFGHHLWPHCWPKIFTALTWPCHIIEEERSKSSVFWYILVDKSMAYSYNDLAAQISASMSPNNDFGRAVSLCLLIRNCRFFVVMSHTIFFQQ